MQITFENEGSKWWAALIMLCFFQITQAQQLSSPADSIHWERLEQVKVYQRANKTDSALIVIADVLTEVRNERKLNTHLGNQALLWEAFTLERNKDDTLALNKLMLLREKTESEEDWSSLAGTELVLALLYERASLAELSRQALDNVRYQINTHGLDSLYPHYAIRNSSYHRMFGDQDSSKYYALEGLRTAPQYGQLHHEVDAVFLLGVASKKEDINQSIEYFKRAVSIFKELKNMRGISFQYNSLTNMYIGTLDFELAKITSDSALHYGLKTIESGYDRFPLEIMLETRSDLFAKMGMLDSALYYANETNDYLGKRYETDLLSRIAELDERNKIAQKEREIAERDQEISKQRNRFYSITAFLIIIIGLTSLLFFLNRRLRKTNNELDEKTALLKELAEQKDRFFVNVSHELKTPLTLILNPLTRLRQRNAVAPPHHQLLDIAFRNAHNLQRLVSRILDITKGDLGPINLKFEHARLSTFFAENCKQFSGLMANRQQTLEYVEKGISEEMVAELDLEKWRQIIYNLLENAVRHTPENGKIKVNLVYEDESLLLEVANTGSPIPPQNLNRLFDRFYQSEQADEIEQGGLGIGLFLCRAYVQLFKGTIQVESNEQFTVFRLVCPITIVDEAVVMKAETNIVESILPILPTTDLSPSLLAKNDKLKAETVLLVEDNLDLQQYLGELLSSHFNLEFANDGLQALAKINVKRTQGVGYSLVLTDVMMPNMDGFTLVQEMKNDPFFRTIPILMLTARSNEKDRAHSLRIGADDYMTKPFSDAELINRITLLLDRNQLRHKLLIEDGKSISGKPQISEEDQNWLTSFEQFVFDNLNHPFFGVEMLAKEFAMSESSLLRQLKKLTGLSTQKYIQELRLERARRKILNGSTFERISDIAAAIGYKDTKSFVKAFKKRFGETPKSLRNRN